MNQHNPGISLGNMTIILLTAFLALFVLAGCASTQHAQTTSSTSTTPATATTTTVEPTTGTTTTTGGVTQHTTTTTTETVPERHSLFGGIFYAVGEVVALPFKLIGGLFDAIF